MFEGTLLFIFGVCIGSFLNVLIDRLSNDETILGRSHCDHCKKTLTSKELIPIISFLSQKARCRNCHKKLSWLYPAVELLTGVTFVLVWFYLPTDFLAAAYPNLVSVINEGSIIPLTIVKLCMLGIISCIIVMFFADLKYFIIPDWVQLGLAYFALLLFFIGDINLQTIVYRLGSGIIVMLPMLAIYLFTKGRGLGFGDVKLAANLGFFMGIQYALAALYMSFIIGALIGTAILLVKRGTLKTKIPFGPFILIGTLLVIFAFKSVEFFIYFYYGF